MSEQTSAPKRVNQRLIIGGIVGLLLLIALLFLIRIAGQGNSRPLLPALPPPTTVNSNPDQQPVLLSLPQLNSDPFAYLNQTIQISGAYTPLPSANCRQFSGPDIRWALVADNLQLDALGYERIVKILQPGTQMTVEGVWRLYQGPRGCGKGPERADIWYLQVTMIVQPHPLVSNGTNGPAINIDNGGAGLPPLLPTAVPASSATPQEGLPTATMDTAVTPVPFTPTAVVTLPPSLTPTLPGSGQTPVVTLAPLPTSTPPQSGTQLPATATPEEAATATAVTPDDITGTPTATATEGPIIPTATTDPDGYPPVPTETPKPY